MTETMTRMQIEDLPIGTVYTQYGHHYVRWIDGQIDHTGGFTARFTDEQAETLSIEIVHRPDEPLFNETWAQWMDRMAVTTNLAAHVNSVNIDGANRALAKAAIATPATFRKGGWGTVYERLTRIEGMDGTMLQFGFPDHWSTFGIWRKSECVWHKTLGGMRDMPRYAVGLVLEAPDVLPEVAEPGQQAKEDYLLHVYTSAMESKSSESWCGVAEQTMARLGIDERSTRPIRLSRLTPPEFTVGEGVRDHDHLHLAPAGQHVLNHGALWFKREDGLWQRHGMQRTVTPIAFDVHNTRWSNAPDASGTPAVGLIVDSHEQMDNAPVGSQIGEYGSFWTKGDDQQWSRDSDRFGSRFEARRFTLGSLTWTALPERTPGTAVNHEAMDAAPVGARVTRERNLWTKQTNGEWLHEADGTCYATHRFALENLVWAEPMTIPVTIPMPVGRAAGREGLRMAPPGARIGGAFAYTRSHDGHWYRCDEPTNRLNDPAHSLTWLDPAFRSGEPIRQAAVNSAPMGSEIQAIDRWRKVAENVWQRVVRDGVVEHDAIRVPDASVAQYTGTWA